MRTFLTGLDEDIRKDLMIELRNLWTHSSTAIEGNVLTLGETAFVLGEGLTVAGKPLKDHEEIVGHAKAIEIFYCMVNNGGVIKDQDLFALHRAVQTAVVVDIYRPVGAWKLEPNGAWARGEGDRPFFHEFASPEDVPVLMREWLAMLNHSSEQQLTEDEALSAYVRLHVSFVRIHPFFDGNGRMARLLANLPVLRCGYPPILIPTEERSRYVHALGDIDAGTHRAEAGKPLVPPDDLLTDFNSLCREAWAVSGDLVARAWRRQRERHSE